MGTSGTGHQLSTACGLGDLHGLSSPLSLGRISNPLIVEEPWFWGCGQTNLSCKMVKGKLVEAGKWPWQVSLLFMGMYICSGSVIHHEWILTAAHCLERSLDASKYSVIVGAQHLPVNGTHLSLSRLVPHEDFQNLISDDIALLRLKEPIHWSPIVQPICLPTAKLLPNVGDSCWAIVWGRPSHKVVPNSSYSLQEISVRIVNSEVCKQHYQFLFLKGQKKFIGKDVLCTHSTLGVDSCQVSSGSSLVCQKNKTWVQMGVESWSFSCKQHYFPNIYTGTSYFTPWIKKQISGFQFTSRAQPAFLNPVVHPGYILLVSWGALGLL